jgi:ribonuclease HII
VRKRRDDDPQFGFEFPRPELGAPELAARARGLVHIAGIDEAGRGPLAGPVVAACVVLPAGHRIVGLNDSKQLEAADRERLDAEVRAAALAFAVAQSSPARIDEINILEATREAMLRALARVAARVPVELVLVDGNCPIATTLPQRTLVGGDGLSENIAAASILAKVARDAMMVAMHARHPQYGFDKHKGYGTPEHFDALRAHGPCPEHRRSFQGVVVRAS